MFEMLVKFNSLRQVYRLMLRPIIMNAYSRILVVMEAKKGKSGLLVDYQQRSTHAQTEGHVHVNVRRPTRTCANFMDSLLMLMAYKRQAGL